MRAKFKRSLLYRRFQPYTMIPKDTFIANLEIVCRFSEVPGAVVECGTWKGGMIGAIASWLGAYRDYVLCDSFQGLPEAKEIDGAAAMQWQQDRESPGFFDNCTASVADAQAAMALAGVKNPHIVKGWFSETLPDMSLDKGISILRLDADWYESTSQILDSLGHLVNQGGLILVDDYFKWDGCSRALHEYLAKTQSTWRIRSHKSVCFLIVD